MDISTSGELLWSGFLESSTRFPNRAAIEVAGHETSYHQLAQRAKRLAATIQEGAGGGAVPLTGIFAYRSETTYAGVLGALMAGQGYVPLNRTFPVDRSRSMLQRSMCRSVSRGGSLWYLKVDRDREILCIRLLQIVCDLNCESGWWSCDNWCA